MADGLVSQNEQGTPQGGPLSPLLSNIYLTKFDRMLEERGHKFVRTKVRGMRMIVTSTSKATRQPLARHQKAGRVSGPEVRGELYEIS
jgi:retron-type reverse transcriptase